MPPYSARWDPVVTHPSRNDYSGPIRGRTKHRLAALDLPDRWPAPAATAASAWETKVESTKLTSWPCQPELFADFGWRRRTALTGSGQR